MTEPFNINFTTLEVLLPISDLTMKKVEEYSALVSWKAEGTAAERFILEEQGPFSERKHIVLADHSRARAETKLKHLIPNTKYTVNIFSGRLDRLSKVSIIDG